VTSTGWRRRAACREEDPELFYPSGTTGSALARLAKAKAICARCPVTAQCLAWALNTGEQFGVWGGKSEDERKKMRPHHRPPTP
jgi:WhiB family transcriptional regulator, redox-sensing transcriptional regulator